jgi:pimeloyl-ACP methyl ester carboxylesterase
MPFFKHDGHRLAYTEFGEGPRTCVLVHGLLLSQKMHKPLAKSLAARGNHVVTIDLLGHGRSDRPRDMSRYSMSAFGEQVVGLLDHLDVDEAVIAGTSLGANTALEVLWLAPEIARGVLGYLAANQATAVAPARDAEPGKILHEARGGEMAALGEVPFGRYYGSVDATPLFVILAAAHHRRTGDLTFLKSIAPSIQRAVDWIERYGDADGDGFVEYARQTPTGLFHQGWKDSHDSVFHEDGTLAEPPIALVEVQAYVFGAWQAAAEIAIALGGGSGDALAKAESYLRKAEAMRTRFEARFWDEQLGCYVLALDAQKRPCRVVSSNAGHALWPGHAEPVRQSRPCRRCARLRRH